MFLKIKILLLFGFFALLLVPAGAWAQTHADTVVIDSIKSVMKKGAKKEKKTGPPAVLANDTTGIVTRTFDEEQLKAYQNNPDFDYKETKPDTSPSIWAMIMAFIFSILGAKLGESPWIFVLIKYLVYALILGGAIFVILRMAGVNVSNIFRRKSKKVGLPYTELTENIHEISFDHELNEALSRRNFRLAVRLLYLRCLKQLSDANLIDWKADKTNTAYYYELSGKPLQQSFGPLTQSFEYVWYGNFDINEQVFNEINVLFTKFEKQLP